MSNTKQGHSGTPLVSVLVLLGVWGFLLLNMIFFVDTYGVDLLYGDQWDYLRPVFEGASLWELFRFQHGPHRMGVGLILDSWILQSTSWSARAEGFFAVGLMFLSSLLALGLKVRVCRSISVFDVAIALIFLYLAQYELLVLVPNLSHGPLPVLLVLSVAHVALSQNTGLRLFAYCVLDFVLVYTGFGIFAGLLIPLLILIEMYQAWRYQSDDGQKCWKLVPYLAALVCTSLSLLSFFYEFDIDPSNNCPATSAPLVDYARFVIMIFNKFIGVFQPDGTFFLGGLFILVMVGAGSAYGIFLLQRDSDSTSRAVARSLSFLIGFSVLFAVGTAYGRVCATTLAFAHSSRYTPYVMPATLAVYILFQMALRKGTRILGSICIIAALLVGHFHNFKIDKKTFIPSHEFQVKWTECYREKKSVGICSEQLGAQLHPCPSCTAMESMLSDFELNGLNLFSEES
jgi:hypothetical protein